MKAMRRALLRLAPARFIESAARRALRDIPGISALEELRVERAAGQMPRVTASLRVASGHDPREVCRSAALAIFEQLPPVELRIAVAGEPKGEQGQVLRLTPT